MCLALAHGIQGYHACRRTRIFRVHEEYMQDHVAVSTVHALCTWQTVVESILNFDKEGNRLWT